MTREQILDEFGRYVVASRDYSDSSVRLGAVSLFTTNLLIAGGVSTYEAMQEVHNKWHEVSPKPEVATRSPTHQ